MSVEEALLLIDDILSRVNTSREGHDKMKLATRVLRIRLDEANMFEKSLAALTGSQKKDASPK